MADTLEAFVEKLQKEGVLAGQEAAERLLAKAHKEAEAILASGGKRGRIPELWDGRAAERAAAVLAAELGVP